MAKKICVHLLILSFIAGIAHGEAMRPAQSPDEMAGPQELNPLDASFTHDLEFVLCDIVDNLTDQPLPSLEEELEEVKRKHGVTDEEMRQATLRAFYRFSDEVAKGDVVSACGVHSAIRSLAYYGAKEDLPMLWEIIVSDTEETLTALAAYLAISQYDPKLLPRYLCDLRDRAEEPQNLDTHLRRRKTFTYMLLGYGQTSPERQQEILGFCREQAIKEPDPGIANHIAQILLLHDPGFKESELFKSMQKRFEGRNGWDNGKVSWLEYYLGSKP